MKTHVVLMLAIAFIGQMASATVYRGTDLRGEECYIAKEVTRKGVKVGVGNFELPGTRLASRINNTYSVFSGGRLVLDVTVFPVNGTISAMTYRAFGQPQLCSARLSDVVKPGAGA